MYEAVWSAKVRVFLLDHHVEKSAEDVRNGDGNQTRSFCYIDDMIDALILMMNSNHQGPFNLGNPHCEFTLNRLAQIFETIIQEPLCKIYLNSTQDDPKMRKPVIEKATQYLGWRPKIGLEEGLKKTMAYFMNDGQK